MQPHGREKEVVHEGSGNVFRDLGFDDWEELSTKTILALHIRDIVKARRLTQNQVAELFGLSQPKVSALLNGKLEGYSVERLLKFITLLGRDVEIRLKKTPRNRPGQIRVAA